MAEWARIEVAPMKQEPDPDVFPEFEELSEWIYLLLVEHEKAILPENLVHLRQEILLAFKSAIGHCNSDTPKEVILAKEKAIRDLTYKHP